MIFKQDKLKDFNNTQSLEWLETNGLGGYASSTVSGTNSRRYHGLLVAALHPPVGRTVMLSKLEETILFDEKRFELGTNQYPGTIHPQGFQYLKSFERNLFPEFVFEAGKVKLKKTIAAIHGENTTLIIYEVLEAGKKFDLELLPLCSSRDYHSMSHANDSIYKGYLFQDGVFQTKNYENSPELFIKIPQSNFEVSGHWYNNFEYSVEHYRGLDFQEDLFNHGKFTITLKKGDKVGVIISTDDPSEKDAFRLFEQEQKRRETLVSNFTENVNIRRLVLAADQFVVKRGDDLKTIIAGYHWFSDWGRDTMISLPGLCLTTGRYDDAKKILKAFAESVSGGMLPNRFPDFGEAPEYNTVDATLWYFHAVYKYFQYTGDKDFVCTLLPILKNIIEWHYKGTRYAIHVDADELLYAGQNGVQLTWMDAKVGDWVVTPRKGKAVEINALWYNALSIMSELLTEAGEVKEAEIFKQRAERVHASFNQKFWNKSLNYLYDFIDGDHCNEDLRPNQIYALSLPFSLLPRDKAQKVFKAVSEKLLTPRGLRSLSPDHKEYKPVYGGDQWHRDGAYHQGTVWSFLLGPYIDALISLKGNKGKAEASAIINTFFDHLNDAGVGAVSEIFDAAPPHAPRGCIAQAWGVGEILRVAIEYNLLSTSKAEK
jgi:predicted glycogen debranching enzyme